jgi:acyl-CoA synthetase (NDP forming)
VGILSSSGGGTGIASDRVSELGLRLAVLSPATRAGLGELLLPPQADNPIDLGGRRKPEEVEIAGDAARIMFADPDVAYGLAILTSMPFFTTRTKLIGEAAQAADKPVMITLTPGAAAEAPRRALRDIGQFYFDRFEDALQSGRARGGVRRVPRRASGPRHAAGGPAARAGRRRYQGVARGVRRFTRARGGCVDARSGGRRGGAHGVPRSC